MKGPKTSLLRDLSRKHLYFSPHVVTFGGDIWCPGSLGGFCQVRSPPRRTRGVLSKVVSSGFSCRVPQASIGKHPQTRICFRSPSREKLNFWQISGLQSFEPQKEVSIIPPKSGKSFAKNCNSGQNSLDRTRPIPSPHFFFLLFTLFPPPPTTN